MKKLVLLFAVVAAVACVSCTAKKAEAPATGDSTAVKVDTAKVDTAKVDTAAAPVK